MSKKIEMKMATVTAEEVARLLESLKKLVSFGDA
jgi:hypothetical protein